MYSVVSGSAPLNPSLCIWSPTVLPFRQFREQLDDVLAESQIPNPFCPLFSDIDSAPQTPETNEILYPSIHDGDARIWCKHCQKTPENAELTVY